MNSSTSDNLPIIKDRKKLEIPFGNHILITRTLSNRYKYIGNITYSSESSIESFKLNSKTLEIYEADDDNYNSILLHFNEIQWFCAGRLKNPGIKITVYKGFIDRKNNTNLFKTSNTDVDIISCGLMGSVKPFNMSTLSFTSEMCLICSLFGNSYQFTLRDTEKWKLNKPLPGDMNSFRGSLKQCCDLLQLIMRFPIDSPISLLDSLSIIQGRPLRYQQKSNTGFEPDDYINIGTNISCNCCLACLMSYTILSSYIVTSPELIPVKKKLITNKIVIEEQDENPFCTINNGVLNTSKNYIGPQIDLANLDGMFYVGSHILLLTTDLFSCPPDIWTHAIIKYWHKKYRVLFVHLYEQSSILDNAVNSFMEKTITIQEFKETLNDCKLSNIEMSRQWIFPNTCRHVLIYKPENTYRENICTRENTCTSESAYHENALMDKSEIQDNCHICGESVDYIAGITENPISNISSNYTAEELSFTIDKGPDYTMGASTDDIFNSSMVTPISSVYITMRSLIPVHAAKNFTWPSSYPLDQISIVREFVRLLQSHWFHTNQELPNHIKDTSKSICYWGLRCDVCNRKYHAKCLHPPNARIPPIKSNNDDTIYESGLKDMNHVPIYHYLDDKKTHLSFDKWKCQDCSECVYCKLPLSTPILPDITEEISTSKRSSRKKEVKVIGKSGIVRCVSCNFGAHGVCCNPAVPRLHFLSFWRCDDCRRCLGCGWQDKHYCDYTNWDSQFLFCRRCNYLIGQLNYCAVCYGIWSPDGVNVPMAGSRQSIYSTSTHGERLSHTWIQCGGCSLWLHTSCDSIENESIATISLRDVTYRCPICRSSNRNLRYYRILEQLFLLDKNNELRYKVPQSFVLYWRLVKNPINLSQIKYKLETLGYNSDEDFIRDILLIPHNVKLMSMPNAKVFKLATSFEKKCKSLISRILTDAPSPMQSDKKQSFPGIRPNISRLSSLTPTKSDDLVNRIKELIKVLGDYTDATANIDSTLRAMKESIFGRTNYGQIPLKTLIDLHYNALFARSRRLSIISEFDWIDVESCHICQSIDNQNDFLFCRTCGTPAHLSCLGLSITRYRNPYRYQCANCVYCTSCGGSCNSGHPLDVSNISDIGFGEKSGWISKHMSDNLSKTRLNGIGFLPELGRSDLYTELLYDKFHLRLCPPCPPGPIEKHAGPIRTISCSYCLASYHLPCISLSDVLNTTKHGQRGNFNHSLLTFASEGERLSWRKNFFNNIQPEGNRNWIGKPVVAAFENCRKIGKRYRNIGLFPPNKLTNSMGILEFICSQECANSLNNEQFNQIHPGSISACCSLCSTRFTIAHIEDSNILLPLTFTALCPNCSLDLSHTNPPTNPLTSPNPLTNSHQLPNSHSHSHSQVLIPFKLERLDRLMLVSNQWIYGLLHCVASSTPLVPRDNQVLVQGVSDSSIEAFVTSDFFKPIYRIAFDLVGSLLRSCITEGLLYSIEGIFNSSLSMLPNNLSSFDLELAHTEIYRQISSNNAEFGPKSEIMTIICKLIWVVCCQFIAFQKYDAEHKNRKKNEIIQKPKDIDVSFPIPIVTNSNPNSICSLLGRSFICLFISNKLKSLNAPGQILQSVYYNIKLYNLSDSITDFSKCETKVSHYCILCNWNSCPDVLGNLIQFTSESISSVHGECLAWSIHHDLLTKSWNPVFNSLITIQPLPVGVPFTECMYLPAIIPPIEVPLQVLFDIISVSKTNICGICDKSTASIKCYGNCGNIYHLPCIYKSSLPFYYTGRKVWCMSCWTKAKNYRFEQMKHFIQLAQTQGVMINDNFINCEGMGGGAAFILSRQTRQRIRIVGFAKPPLLPPSALLVQNQIMTLDNKTRTYQGGYLIIRRLLDHTPYPAGYIYHRRWWHRFIPNTRTFYILYTNLKRGVLNFVIYDPQTLETFSSSDLLHTTSAFISTFKTNADFISNIIKVRDNIQLRNFAETFFGFNDPINIRRNREKYLNYVKKRLERLHLPDELANCKIDTKNQESQIELENEIQVVFDSQDKSTEEFRPKKKFDTLSSSMLYRYTQSLSHPERLRVKPSPIHGIGLFANQLIPSGEPVIEYIGELIRDVVSDLREKIYNDKWGSGGSCYMFKLNDQLVVDATRMGNMARFINHSCEPNCICRIITSDTGIKHIIIFAKRDINPGDEITYNYQFGIEAETNKLSCHCGAPSCLGRMN